MKRHILAIISVSSFVAVQAQPLIDYKTQVDPLFFKNGCSPCHGGSGGLYVDTYHDLMTTGYNAPVVVAYDSNSYLVLRLKGLIQPRMPRAIRIIEDEHRSLAAVLHGLLYLVREIRLLTWLQRHLLRQLSTSNKISQTRSIQLRQSDLPCRIRLLWF